MINKIRTLSAFLLITIGLAAGLLSCVSVSEVNDELRDVLIIGSAEYPDPVLERVLFLEKTGVLRNVIIMESFPVKIRVTGSKEIITEIQKIPRKILSNLQVSEPRQR